MITDKMIDAYHCVMSAPENNPRIYCDVLKDAIQAAIDANKRPTMLLYKEYDGESIVDSQRDLHEAFEEAFTPVCKNIPKDEYGFYEGTFTITITHRLDE